MSPLWIIPLRGLFILGMMSVAFSAYGIEYENPIKVKSFLDLITTIAKAVVAIGIPLATAAIVFIGIRIVIAAAGGNPSKVQEAKKLLWYVLIGTVVIVGAAYLAEAAVKFAQSGFK